MIVSISTEQAPLLRAYARKKGATFTLLTDPTNSVGSQYGVDGVPTNILLGSDGRAVDALVGYSEEEFDKHIARRIPSLVGAPANP